MAQVNVEGTRKLIAAARNRIGHWVQLSSVAVYGIPRCGVITEETPTRPETVYGNSKAEADRLLIEAGEKGEVSCSILRPSKIFGGASPSGNDRILFRMISIIDAGMFFFVGKPGAVTHYVHLDNVVEALLRCGTSGARAIHTYDLSDDCPIEEFVAVIARALGKPLPGLRLPEAPVRFLARTLGRIPGFPLNEPRLDALLNRAAFPYIRIKRELGYEHLVPVGQGLRELVAAWKRNH
jgi:nucleoside-diphosphate-sugar epimerase